MEAPVSHQDVTTIMALLAGLDEDVKGVGSCWKRTMAKRKIQKLTAEDDARHEQFMRKVRARIAEREALEQSWEQERLARLARKSLGRRLLERLRLAS